MESKIGQVVAVCSSKAKGESKQSVTSADLKLQHGLQGDAHAGDWHRQVSLLAEEKIDEMRALGLKLAPGAFGENLVTRDAELATLQVGDCLQVGTQAKLQITQLGKECHTPCAIYHQVGRCIMPTEGVFARVIEPGRVVPGDAIVRIQPTGT